MKQTVSVHKFVDAFTNAGRANQFSLIGLEALFDYLEECEKGGEETELDVIALCCEFSEHKNAIDGAQDLLGFDPEEGEEAALEALRDRTDVIQVEGGAIITHSF